jgi:antirestriction protein ArdC
MSTVYQIITDQIIAQLDNGVVPWRKPWNGQEMPSNYVSKKSYRGINTFLLGLSRYNSSKWITFKQATQLKARVRKGEKSSMVVFYKPFTDRDKIGTPEEDKIAGFMLRYYRVFNTEQVDGLPKQEAIDLDKFEHNPIERCELIINNMPSAPKLVFNEQRAYYKPLIDTVNMPRLDSFPILEEYYSTLFHEFAHSTGHKSRLDRKGVAELNPFGSHNYTREELIAEMTASMLCGITGIDNITLSNSVSYLDNWRRRISKDVKLIITAAAQAQKAADCIQGITFNH